MNLIRVLPDPDYTISRAFIGQDPGFKDKEHFLGKFFKKLVWRNNVL
jgi:hypothetical protein